MAGDNGTSDVGSYPQCTGTTRRGSTCRRDVLPGTDRCEYHQRPRPMVEAAKTPAVPYSDTQQAASLPPAPSARARDTDFSPDQLRDAPSDVVLRAMVGVWDSFCRGDLNERQLKEARETLDRLGALAESVGPPEPRDT